MKSPSPEFGCAECDYKTNRKWSLLRHTRIHLGTVGGPNRRFEPAKKDASEKRPERSRKIAQRYECALCHRLFSRKAYIREHVKIHATRKPLRCERCDFECVQRATMSYHKRMHADQKPFQCAECGHCSRSKQHLLIHASTHTGVKPHRCPFCEAQYTQKYRLDAHMRVHRAQKRFRCSNCCGRSFYTGEELRQHRQCRRQPSHECQTCGRHFSSLGALNRHSRTHASVKIKRFACADCAYTADRKYALLLHTRSHGSGGPRKIFRCSACGRAFATKSNLVGHIRTHAGERRYQCADCAKKFERRVDMVAHARKHLLNEIPEFRCAGCGLAFSGKGALTKHTRLRCTKKETYECDKCDYVSLYKKPLIRHIGRAHKTIAISTTGATIDLLQGEAGIDRVSQNDSREQRERRRRGTQPHEIPYERSRKSVERANCAANISNRRILSDRTKRSENQKEISSTKMAAAVTPPQDDDPFQLCSSNCGTIESVAQSVEKSKNTGGADLSGEFHTFPAPKLRKCGRRLTRDNKSGNDCVSYFECSICGSRLKSKQSMKIHAASHRPQKAYGCADCGLRFATRTALRVHGRIHTGERPFECDKCGRRYTRKGYLKWHLKTHSKERPYECAQCDKRYGRPDHLKRHTESRHAADCKPFRCHACDKRFAAKVYLKRHVLHHMANSSGSSSSSNGDKRSLQCDSCARRYGLKADLVRHIKRHYAAQREAIFECDFCAAKFRTKALIARHIRERH